MNLEKLKGASHCVKNPLFTVKYMKNIDFPEGFCRSMARIPLSVY